MWSTLMPGEFLEVKPRDFNPMSVPGLTQEARDGVNAALKAMSTWRNEIADTNKKNGKRVIEKMAEAAATLGCRSKSLMPLARSSKALPKFRSRRWIN